MSHQRRPYVNPRLPNPLCTPAKTRSKSVYQAMAEAQGSELDNGVLNAGTYVKDIMDDDLADGRGGARPKDKSLMTTPPPPKDVKGDFSDEQKRLLDDHNLQSAQLKKLLFERQQSERSNPADHSDQSDVDDEQYTVSPSELATRMKYLTALNELQVKEQEILNLRKRLSTEKSRVIKSADIKPTKYSGSADLEDYLVS